MFISLALAEIAYIWARTVYGLWKIINFPHSLTHVHASTGLVVVRLTSLKVKARGGKLLRRFWHEELESRAEVDRRSPPLCCGFGFGKCAFFTSHYAMPHFDNGEKWNFSIMKNEENFSRERVWSVCGSGGVSCIIFRFSALPSPPSKFN